MNNLEIHIDFEILATKFLLNEATPLEQEQLLKLIKSDDAHKAAFLELKGILFDIKTEVFIKY